KVEGDGRAGGEIAPADFLLRGAAEGGIAVVGDVPGRRQEIGIVEQFAAGRESATDRLDVFVFQRGGDEDPDRRGHVEPFARPSWRATPRERGWGQPGVRRWVPASAARSP